MLKIELGCTYAHKISGAKGVATGYVQYITGCNQVLLQPRGPKTKMEDSFWVDESRVQKVKGPKLKLEPAPTKPIGFDKAPPIH